MIKNFMAMPILLKLLTATAFAVPIFVIGTMIPHGSVNVGGRELATSAWWTIGAGPFLLVVALLFCASIIGMLRRVRYSRFMYILSWIALSAFIPYVASVTGAGLAVSKPGTISNLLLAGVIGLYLYLNKGARSYFRSG